MKRLLLLSLAILATIFSAQAALIYVDLDATGADNGSSWVDAYTDLQDALAAATSGDDIWIAEGIYTPTSGADRTISFEISGGLTLYGGFTGSETSLDQRDWVNHESVLSGAIGSTSITDNSITVVSSASPFTGYELNGVVIEDGYNAAPSLESAAIDGATELTLRNSIIRNCEGRYVVIGAFFDGLLLENSIVTGNSCRASGIISESACDSSPLVTHCVFYDNENDGLGGVLGGCAFNTWQVANTIIWDNANSAFASPQFDIINCIVNNYSLNASDNATNLISLDPEWVDPVNGNFKITSSSPAIDEGNNLFIVLEDYYGNQRSTACGFDIGVHEFQTIPFSGDRYYVDASATGSNDGNNWNNAFTLLSTAFGIAQPGDEIWVAEGIYKPSSSGNRAQSFNWPADVKVLGGFEGNEFSRFQREPKQNLTILSGDIGAIGVDTDNSYNVIKTLEECGSYFIEGFVIEGGYADGSFPSNYGGAILAEEGVHLTITDCWLRNNHADFGGGAMRMVFLTGEVQILRSLFENNDATQGQDIWTTLEYTLANSFFINHSGSSYLLRTNGFIAGPQIINCNFTQNDASGIFFGLQDAQLTNCITWDNNFSNPSNDRIEVSYSIHENLESGQDLGNNLDTDPLWEDPAGDDYRLTTCSPAINAGLDGANPYALDFTELDRFVGAIDMGAYERQNLNLNVIYVDQDASGANDGSSWANAYTDLHDAFAAANTCDEIWVAEGIYKPSSSNNRDAFYNIDTPGISVLGGFNGTETNADQRDWAANETVISGAIGSQTDITDNSKKLLRIQTGSFNAVEIDGIKFRRAYATVFSGGTVSVNNSSANFKNCIWNLNSQTSGGALHTNGGGSNPVIRFENCLVYDNHNFSGGGVVDSDTGTLLKVVNSTFTQNTNDQSFGAVISADSFGSAEVQNTIVYGNEFPNDGTGASVYANCLVDISLGGGDDTNILSGDPLFADPANNEFRLGGIASPAVDAGDNAFSATQLDLDHNPRVFENTIDLGCYELQSGIIYVDADASGANDGSSWNNAFVEMYDALAAANYGSEIWVAEGIYLPQGANRTDAFMWPGNTLVYGGFDGTETERDQRLPKVNACVLSGDIGTPNNNSDNTYRVIYMDDINANMHIDGFIVSNGKADGSNNDGAGIYVRRCIDLDMTEVLIRDCNAEDLGGAMWIRDMEGVATIDRCSFFNNVSDRGTMVSNKTVEISNSIFSGNISSTVGTFWDNGAGSPTLENCNFYGNTASALLTGSGTTFNNCIVWDNTISLFATGATFNSCILQEGMTTGIQSNTLFEDPQWANPAAGNFSIPSYSPAFNSGDDTLVNATLDFDGNDRILLGQVDRGALEQSDPTAGIRFVDEDATGANDGSSWADAYTLLQDALSGGQGLQIWVAEGSYRPTETLNVNANFNVPSSCQVYGGFDGTETALDQRDWSLNYTEISGLLGSGGSTANSILLVNVSNNAEPITLDGFTLRDANSVDATIDSRAAISVSSAAAYFANCTIMKNDARSGAGAFVSGAAGSFARFDNCLFFKNSIFSSGIIIANGPIEMYNCTMTNNIFGVSFNTDIGGNTSTGSAKLYNSIFWEPGFNELGGPANVASAEVLNCIANDTTAPINADPMFTNVVGDDYSIQQNSPANNAGANAFVDSDLDLAGNDRIQNDTVDIGCFEQEFGPSNCAEDLNGDGLVNSADLVLILADFGCTSNCSADINGDDQTNGGDLVLLLSAFDSTCD